MIQVTSLVDKIAGALQQEIAQGKLRPGHRLPPERSLCVDFGVGRTTVREALKVLAVRGLITRQGRGMIVNDPQNAAPLAIDFPALAIHVNIKQLYEVRKLLEVKIAGWAAQRANAEDLRILRQSLHPVAPKALKLGSPNRSFHDALANAAHNPALVQIYESASNLFFRLPFFWKLFDDSALKTVRGWRHKVARQWHEHIFQAIEQHDAAEAEGAMFQHLDIMEKDLLSRLQDANDNGSLTNDKYSHPMLDNLRPTQSALPAIPRLAKKIRMAEKPQ